MPRPIAGATAVVTGASSGIGEAITTSLARRGARLVLASRSEDKLRAVADALTHKAVPRNREEAVVPAPLVVPTDVAIPEHVADLAANVHSEIGPVDILVNNAGIGHWSPFVDLSAEQARRIFDVNVFGAMACTRAFLPRMLERGSGTLVFISSALAEWPFPGASVYCASKAALNGFASALRSEVEPAGIRVLLVMPALTRTSFFDANAVPPSVLGRYLLQRMHSPEAVAERVVKGIEKGKRRVVMERLNDFWIRLAGLSPGLQASYLSGVGRHLRQTGTWNDADSQ